MVHSDFSLTEVIKKLNLSLINSQIFEGLLTSHQRISFAVLRAAKLILWFYCLIFYWEGNITSTKSKKLLAVYKQS